MKEYQIDLSKNKKTKSVDIKLQGHLNVVNITKLQKDLNTAVKNQKQINLEISKVDDADMSLIQLLVAFRKHCQSTQVDLNISLELNNEISELFARAGFANTINN